MCKSRGRCELTTNPSRGLATVLIALTVYTTPGAASSTEQADTIRAKPPAHARHWVSTWYGSPAESSTTSDNQSYRLIVHYALGGGAIRLRVGFRYGLEPLTLSSQHRACSGHGTGATSRGAPAGHWFTVPDVALTFVTP